MRQLLLAKEHNKQWLLSLPGVNGVGVNFRDGKVRIYVEKAKPAVLQALPLSVAGFPVETIELGIVSPLVTTAQSLAPAAIGRNQRWRPAPGGVSCGHYKITAGTLGVNVFDGATPQKLLLSNNHVIANSDFVEDERAFLGDSILQPGPFDGGTEPYDTIATLYRWVKISKYDWNLIDAALGLPLNPDDLISNEILDIGTIFELLSPGEGMFVRKSGRTTGVTEGVIWDITATVVTNWDVIEEGLRITFDDQIIAGMETKGGDSGSLLVSGENRAVGLCFAGTEDITVANKATNVVSMLGIQMGVPIEIPPESPVEIVRNIAMFGMFGTMMGGIAADTFKEER